MSLSNRVKAEADLVFDEVVRLRRTIHQRPELAFQELETSRLVHDTLQTLPVSMQTGIAKTGIVATLEGAHPGPTLMLRADMDALPIHEENTHDFVSLNPGKMHACGHDAHTSSLLGTAMILSALKDELHGNVQFIFQPSEEKLPGGASVMIEEGALSGCGMAPAPETIFGQHVQPRLQTGHIGVRNGMYMASADEIHITIHGEGGHGAAPHTLANDPVLVASHLVLALQTVISRHCPPDVPSILTIGKFIADGATNVIPHQVRLEGTLRSMDEPWRFRAHELIERIVHQTVATFDAKADLDLLVGYPALMNHDAPTDFVRQAANEFVGPECTVELDKWFASEDFAFYLQEIPGAFYRIGTGKESAVHTPTFDIDEEALRTSTGFMAYLALTHHVKA